jgi:hypothetical protein
LDSGVLLLVVSYDPVEAAVMNTQKVLWRCCAIRYPTNVPIQTPATDFLPGVFA